VGRTQYLLVAPPRPPLRQQLLAGVKLKAARPFVRGLPDVQTGPDALQPPEAASRACGLSPVWETAPDQQGAPLAGSGLEKNIAQNRQGLPMDLNLRWRHGEHERYLRPVPSSARSPMSETPSAPPETSQDTGTTAPAAVDHGFDFSDRYQDVVGKLNETLGKVDWSQMGKVGKIVGIFVAVIVAQILIKGVLDTINLLPIIPGLLELLGLVVVGQWSWDNLTTSEKRSAVLQRLQNVRQEYLG
jgi:hypothetical protein